MTDLATGQSWTAPSEASGLQDGRFQQLYQPPPLLLVVGAVQIGQALAAFAGTLGIATAVIDPRERFLTTERFPNSILDLRWPDEAIPTYRPGRHTAIVTLTHDSKIDDPALFAALSTRAGYIAALGSSRSHAARRDRLVRMGATALDVSRIDGPAGVDIGAVGAAEIALSIAAGMVRALHGAITALPAKNERSRPAR